MQAHRGVSERKSTHLSLCPFESYISYIWDMFSRNPKTAEHEAIADLNDAPFVMEFEDVGFEQDFELPTQATLVEPPSTDKGKRAENMHRKQRAPPGIPDKTFKEPLPVRTPTNARVAVVITQPPPTQSTRPPRSASEEIHETPKRKPEPLPLSQSSPTLSKSARKTPSSSAWPPSAQERDNSDRALKTVSMSMNIPLVTEQIQVAQNQKERRDGLTSKQAGGTSDAPFRNTRGRSRSVEPVPLPVPQRRTRKGAQDVREPPIIERPVSTQKIVEEEDEEMGVGENAIPDEETMVVQTVARAAEADDIEETANLTVKSSTTQGSHSVDLEEVERALLEAENEEEEADSQAGSDSDDDSVFEAAQAGAKALLSGQPVSISQASDGTPEESEEVDEVEDTIIVETTRKPTRSRAIEEIQLGYRDYSSATDDAFPSPGTRALGEKVLRKQIQKRGKYNPPRGTKAEMRTRTRA